MTENHNYNVPAQGSIDWHVPLNENFEQLDTDVEIRDAEANMADYTPKDGAKYLAIDTGRRFLGDGSQWTEAPTQPLKDFTVEHTTNDPTDAQAGQVWYREDTDTLKVQLSSGVESLAVGTGGTTDSTDGSTSESHTLEIVPAAGASWNTYTIVIDGEVTNTTNFDSGDTVTKQSDGTVLIEGGIKGGKDPEVVEFTGTLQSISMAVEGDAVLDGTVIDPANY